MAFTSEILDGVNLLLSIDGTPIGASSSCSVELTLPPVTPPTRIRGFGLFAAGTITWSMSSENFVNFGGENVMMSCTMLLLPVLLLTLVLNTSRMKITLGNYLARLLSPDSLVTPKGEKYELLSDSTRYW